MTFQERINLALAQQRTTGNHIRKLPRLKIAAIALTALAAIAAVWYWATPHSYAQCILRNVRAGMGEYAAMTVMHACRELYPSK